MDAHEVTDLLEARRRRGEPYLEFLRLASMSCGLYELPRGGVDSQSAHTEDEIYYVVRGRARIRVGSEDREVRQGSVVFVPARSEHRFHDILEALAVLVFFAPAEGTNPG
jgi:mannose-6-phosphate isomerase-like protein (cupin superfamily)